MLSILTNGDSILIIFLSSYSLTISSYFDFHKIHLCLRVYFFLWYLGNCLVLFLTISKFYIFSTIEIDIISLNMPSNLQQVYARISFAHTKTHSFFVIIFNAVFENHFTYWEGRTFASPAPSMTYNMHIINTHYINTE